MPQMALMPQIPENKENWTFRWLLDLSTRLFQMPNPGNGRHEKVMFFGITGIQKNSYERKQVEQFCKKHMNPQRILLWKKYFTLLQHVSEIITNFSCTSLHHPHSWLSLFKMRSRDFK